MKKVCLLFSILFVIAKGFAQPVHVLSDSNDQFLRHYYLLPDAQYTFDRVLHDTTLPFSAGTQLTYQETGVYWVKIHINNPSEYAQKYALFASPLFDNTVYYYDQDAKKWVENRTGVLTPVRARLYGKADCIIQGGAGNTLYVRMNISHLGNFRGFINSVFLLRKDEYVQQREQLSWTICLATVILVFIFLLYNALIFYHTRDRAYLGLAN